MESEAPDSPTKRFQCSSCPKSYSLKLTLREHIESKHTEGECKSYSCTKCLDSKQLAKSFGTQTLLRQHTQKMHGPLRFKCQVCFKTFSDSTIFRKHQRTHLQDIEKRHKCELCSKVLSSKRTLQNHLFSSHNKKSEGFKYFSCEICPSKYACRSHLERHILIKHVEDKECECVVCSKKFIDQEALEKHMEKHNKPTKYFCDICSKGFKAKSSLIHHLGIVHLKFFYCNKCCRSYGNKSEFDQHSNPKTSLEVKLIFNCQMCGESFDSQCNLDIHTNSHLIEIRKIEKADGDLQNGTDTKPVRPITAILPEEFQCELCSKSFDREIYFTAHRNQVHRNAEWKCSFQECSKTFKKWYQLRLHKLTHMGTKPFACTLCRKAFYHADQLKDHDLSHVKDKKYKCEMCPKSFAKPSHLRVHVAYNHGGPKPFECPVKDCGTSYAQNCQLKSHLVSHKTQRSFKCDMCTTIKDFKSLRHLKQHERKVHLESILIQGGNKLKDMINPKISTKHSDDLVFICCSNNCFFETVEEKNVALHYNLIHALPKVHIHRNILSPPMLEEALTFETKRLIQKRYKCRICLTYFKTNSNFTKHLRTHSKIQ